MTIDQEVHEMTLTALLDTEPFTKALGGDIPCQQEDPELWFAETPEDVEFAKALCGTCPVQQACLLGALDRREPWGVWGGQLFLNGAVVARKKPRGRPRKDAARVEAATVAFASAQAARVRGFEALDATVLDARVRDERALEDRVLDGRAS